MLPIVVDIDIEGNPKGPIRGNMLCWFGNLEFVTKDIEDPTQKLLTRYNYRDKKYKDKPIGKVAMGKALSDWCEMNGIKKEGVNNMWARKTFVNTSLKDLQLPAEQVMTVTGHRSEIQMRNDYHVSKKIHLYVLTSRTRHAKWAVTDANVRTRATLQVFRFLNGDIPRIPATAVEIYAELVNQSVLLLLRITSSIVWAFSMISRGLICTPSCNRRSIQLKQRSKKSAPSLRR